MAKNSAYLERRKMAVEAEIEFHCSIARQQMFDAVFIAANEVFGMGKGRAVRFNDAILDNLNEIALMTKNDVDGLWETKEKLDRRLKEIVGEENFVPWDERYEYKPIYGLKGRKHK